MNAIKPILVLNSRYNVSTIATLFCREKTFMDERENQEPQLRSAEAVHRRALALAYLTCRAMIDSDPHANAGKMSSNIMLYVDGVGLANEFLPHELRLLKSPFGTLDESECIETSWLSEGMVVLAWAIGQAELPSPRVKCDPGPVAIGLGMFQPRTRERLAKAKLRDAREIEAKSLTYLALNWRIGHFIENPGEKMDLAAKLKDPSSPHLLVDEVEMADNDLALDGVPLAKVPRAKAGEFFHIVRERFNAFKWLQGLSAQYCTGAGFQ